MGRRLLLAGAAPQAARALRDAGHEVVVLDGAAAADVVLAAAVQEDVVAVAVADEDLGAELVESAASTGPGLVVFWVT